MHSPKYESIREYFSRDWWDKAKVANAVRQKWITEEEFYEITGELYYE